MTGRRLLGRGVAALALVGLTGCSGSSSASSNAVATDRVELPKSYKFVPAVIQVKAGTAVTWTNHDDFPHNVTVLKGAEKSSRNLGVGESTSITFTNPETVSYQCSLHPQQMQGKIIVTQ